MKLHIKLHKMDGLLSCDGGASIFYMQLYSNCVVLKETRYCSTIIIVYLDKNSDQLNAFEKQLLNDTTCR